MRDPSFSFALITSIIGATHHHQPHLPSPHFVPSNMATLGGAGFGWHHGELQVQRKLNVPDIYNPTFPGLAGSFGLRVAASPMVAIGTLDAQGRPWTTVWAGERGFARPIAENVLGVRGEVDVDHDPVFRALWGLDHDNRTAAADVEVDAVVRPNDGRGKMVSGVSIDLVTRDRVKLAGHMIAGAVTAVKASQSQRDGGNSSSSSSRSGELQMALAINESLGNCPKYFNKREIEPRSPSPGTVERQLPLSDDALRVIKEADLFFLSSTDGNSMDSNHRGGAPGFVRVARNDQEAVELVYPECEHSFLWFP